MDSVQETTFGAFRLLLSGDAELWTIIGISFKVSLGAILIATPPAVLLAFLLAHLNFPGRRLAITLFNTLLAFPSVVAGLLVYMLLSRNGLLGEWKLLFTQPAMIIGQIVLSFPIVVAMSHAAIQAVDRRAWETALTLGARRWQAMLTLLHEVRFGLGAAIIAGFGRIISEVGCSMMVGGNILNYTRNIPTAIALETGKGEFVQGVALGIVLLVMAFALNFTLMFLQGKGRISMW